MSRQSISIAITGSGGSGAVTTGMILLEAMAQAGYYGFMARSAGPQIRGGESAVMLRFSHRPVYSVDDRFDLLLALDWQKVERFVDEIPLDQHSLLLGDSAQGDAPEILTAARPKLEYLALKDSARTIEGGRPNMLGLGVLARHLELSAETMQQALQVVLGRKGEQVVQTSFNGIELGRTLQLEAELDLALVPADTGRMLCNMSGNEASGLGALKAGVRFVAAYPITPASEILEWLAPNLDKVGGALLQAEDELASVNMIIGASFGGVPSLTATSGPGLSLMMEGLGLAVTSETPVVVINVQRGGPSTGIPTKSEQADLNLALYGFHGDAPHLVTAPLHIGDCVFTCHWSVCLAEQMQAVAIVLTDQSIGQSRVVMNPPEYREQACQRRLAETRGSDYQRYQLTRDGISPMSVPGNPVGMYTADGLEHDEHGTPSSISADHQQQMQKRKQKLEAHDYGEHWSVSAGEGDLAIVSWGSSSAVCFEAAERLREQGIETRVVALRLLMPLNHTGMQQALAGCRRVFVVEQNQSGQLYHYLQAEQALPTDSISHARPGPLPMRPDEIVNLVLSQHDNT